MEIFVLKKLELIFFTCTYLYGGKIKYHNDRFIHFLFIASKTVKSTVTVFNEGLKVHEQERG